MVEVKRHTNQRWQFVLLLLLLVPVGGSLLYLLPSAEKPSVAEFHSGSALSQQLLQATNADTIYGTPNRKFPANYKEQGTVDDRYTMAVDAKTGQTVIKDALGGVGTNSTSVEGDRAKLAKDMIALDHYANHHRETMPPSDYNWLKRMARSGMQLAFGLPGISPADQPPLKQGLLSEFHNISANPSDSVMHSGIFTQAEQAAQVAEATYQNLADQRALAAVSGSVDISAVVSASSLLGVDPLSPTLSTLSSSYVGPTSLAGQISSTLLVPDMTSLTASLSPYNTLTTASTSIVAATPDTTSAVPTVPTRSTSVAVTGTTSSSTSASTASTSPAPTVQDYYEVIFSPKP